MSALPIIEAILSAASPVTALLGDRIFYVIAPQGAVRPYAVLLQATESDEHLLQGAAQFPESSINVVVYGDTYPAIEKAGDAVVAALQDASGVYRGKRASIRRDAVDSYDFLPGDRVHRRILGFLVRHRFED